jgi:hypothetical protein
MSRRQKGFSKGQILDELNRLSDLPDEDDDDLPDIEIDPEDLDDDGITETEEVVYEDPVPCFLFFRFSVRVCLACFFS